MMETTFLKLSVAFLIMSFLYGFIRSKDFITGINVLDRFINGLVYLGYLTVFVCLIFGIMFIIEG